MPLAIATLALALAAGPVLAGDPAGCGVIVQSSPLAAGPVLAGDPAAGRQKAQQCQTCHGIDGLARIPEAPHIAGESALYLETQLEAFRSGARQHPVMSVVAQGLSDEDISDLAAWYASIEISVKVPE